jgi:hypothetical protein
MADEHAPTGLRMTPLNTATNVTHSVGPGDARIANPYGQPLRAFVADIRSLDWSVPFLAAAIQLVVLIVLVCLCFVLYCTIGVAAHISKTFWRLIIDSQRRVSQEASAVEKSAYAVATALFFLVFLPFFLIQFPFWLLGSLWHQLGNPMAIFVMSAVLGIGAWLWWSPETWHQLVDYAKTTGR